MPHVDRVAVGDGALDIVIGRGVCPVVQCVLDRRVGLGAGDDDTGIRRIVNYSVI